MWSVTSLTHEHLGCRMSILTLPKNGKPFVEETVIDDGGSAFVGVLESFNITPTSEGGTAFSFRLAGEGITRSINLSRESVAFVTRYEEF